MLVLSLGLNSKIKLECSKYQSRITDSFNIYTMTMASGTMTKKQSDKGKIKLITVKRKEMALFVNVR